MGKQIGMNEVVLDDAEWVTVVHVSLRIAAALVPDQRRLAGIDLIKTKLIATHVNEKPWMPVAINQSDRDLLSRILPQLPALHGNMPKREIVKFRRACRQLPSSDRPTWTPVIPAQPSEATVFSEKMKRLEVAARHRDGLHQEVLENRIAAIDSKHLRVTICDPTTLLRREDVVRYIVERCGLKVAAASNASSTLAVHADNAQLQNPEAGETSGTFTRSHAHDGLTVRWTSEELHEITEYKKHHTWKQVKEKFGISRQFYQKKLQQELERQGKQKA